MFLYCFQALLKKIKIFEALSVRVIQIFLSNYTPVALVFAWDLLKNSESQSPAQTLLNQNVYLDK